jgi:hypothetical protein
VKIQNAANRQQQNVVEEGNRDEKSRTETNMLQLDVWEVQEPFTSEKELQVLEITAIQNDKIKEKKTDPIPFSIGIVDGGRERAHE